jgi:predicted GNAT superfamily acetyltransferase
VSRPWDQARRAAEASGVTLRPLTGPDDVEAINAVVAATWGSQYLEHEVVRALAFSGNVPWGAEADGVVVGFVLGWAGVDVDGLHVHSHMLAAVPDRRHAGVGYALKLAQRAQALDQGIHVMRWTFDPMVARNAWLNLGKLGTVVDRFQRDFYGDMRDDINVGDRTDRFTVRWDLDRDPGPRPVPAAHETVPIPPEYHELRAEDPEGARRLREVAAMAFETYLAAGLTGVAFDRHEGAYVFAREEDAP